VQAVVKVGLINRKKFSLAMNVWGVPIGGAVGAASATTVWQGKPRTE